MAKDYLSPAFNQELAPGATPEYQVLNPETIINILPIKDGGSLVRSFAFTRIDPTVTAHVLNEDKTLTRLGSTHMRDFDTKDSAQAYIKLLQMGGSPFGLRNSK